MYTFNYHFFPLSYEKDAIDAFDEIVTDFMTVLYRNGQEAGSSIFSITTNDYCVQAIAFELDSLDTKYHNKYCEERYERVLKESLKAPQLEYVGRNVNYGKLCVCERSSHYIMVASTYAEDATPIRCGDCGGSVPLLRLPKTFDDEYWTLLDWQIAYEHYDSMYMKGFGEKFCYKMLRDMKSSLNQNGREICAELEGLTKVPVYYRIFDMHKPVTSTCPVCQKLWRSSKEEKTGYQYVCHDCRLVMREKRKA